jgi:regulator of sirC expression with transglutaminase-like and TPR domain
LGRLAVSEASRERFRALVRGSDADAELELACLLIAADFMPDLDEAAIDHWLGVLDTLAVTVPDQGDPVPRLRSALGHFHGDAAVYHDLRASLLPEVLRRRRGLPILLSIVWVAVARRVGVPAWGLGLPGHYVVGVGDPAGTYELVDPFAGGAPLRRAISGTGPVQPWGAVATLARVLANIRRWADRPDRARAQLRAVELTLLLPTYPAELCRERGRLLVRCGDFLGGARQLEAYAQALARASAGSGTTQADWAAEADGALREARMARAFLN